MIRIDVHPAGENSINTPHTFHARFAYSPGPYISRGLHRQPFACPDKDKTGPYVTPHVTETLIKVISK
jgi:hypothetical protein